MVNTDIYNNNYYTNNYNDIYSDYNYHEISYNNYRKHFRTFTVLYKNGLWVCVVAIATVRVRVWLIVGISSEVSQPHGGVCLWPCSVLCSHSAGSEI